MLRQCTRGFRSTSVVGVSVPKTVRPFPYLTMLHQITCEQWGSWVTHRDGTPHSSSWSELVDSAHITDNLMFRTWVVQCTPYGSYVWEPNLYRAHSRNNCASNTSATFSAVGKKCSVIGQAFTTRSKFLLERKAWNILYRTISKGNCGLALKSKKGGGKICSHLRTIFKSSRSIAFQRLLRSYIERRYRRKLVRKKPLVTHLSQTSAARILGESLISRYVLGS